MKKEKIVLFGGIAALIFGALLFVYRSELFTSGRTSAIRYRHPAATGSESTQQIEFLKDRIKKDPTSGLNYAALAQVYVGHARRTGDISWYDKAEEAANQSLEKLKFGNIGAKLVHAQIAESRHEFTKAIEIAKETLKQKPFDDGAYRILITSHLALGDNATAARFADELTQRRPFLSTFSLRALVLAAQGRDEEAMFDFQRALKLEDVGETMESARTRVLYGRFLMNRGKKSEAKSALDEALRILPDYHFALATLGLYEMKQNNHAKAQDLLMKAFTSSKQVPYLVWYAKAKALSSDEAGAAEALATAEKLLRSDLQTHPYGHRLELAKLLLFRNGPKDAQEALKLAVEETKARKTADALFTMSKALMSNGHVEHAKDAIQMVLATGAREAEYFEFAAAIDFKMGDTSRAKFYDELARKLDPDSLSRKQVNVAVQLLDKKKAAL